MGGPGMRRGVRAAAVAAGAIAGCLARPEGTPHNLAFVTSQKYPLMMFGSAADLDATCEALAGGGRHFIAWYSTPAQSAGERLGSARGWVRSDGLPFADRVEDVVRGKIYYPLRLDEARADVGADLDVVATATNGADGTYATGKDCFAGGMPSLVGIADGTTGSWTDINTTAACDMAVRLYCLEVDRSNVLDAPLPPTGAKLAFVTTMAVSATSIAALDTECQMEGAARGVDAVALVSRDAMPASAFLVAASYVRPDGVVAIDAGALQAPINVTLGPTRQYINHPVWSGAMSWTTAGTITDTCGGWGGMGGAFAADSSRSIEAAFGAAGMFDCVSQPQPVYCIAK